MTCWHDWKTWGAEYKEDFWKYAISFAILSFVFTMTFGQAPFLPDSASMIAVILGCLGIVSGVVLTMYGIDESVNGFFPTEDKSCLKCGKRSFKLTKLKEKRRRRVLKAEIAKKDFEVKKKLARKC